MLVLVGPSASGKTEAAKILINKYQMQKLVTCTTRPLREGEIDGKDYHFLSFEEFLKRQKEGFFVESIKYNNNYYGTPYSEINDHKVVILEAQGVKHYINKIPQLIKICFLDCPEEVLRKRLIERHETPENIEKRIKGDAILFSNEIKQLANWVVKAYDVDLETMTETIYRLYWGLTD